MHTALKVLDLPLRSERERERKRERRGALTDPEGRVRKVATPPINLFPPLEKKMKRNK